MDIRLDKRAKEYLIKKNKDVLKIDIGIEGGC